MIASHVDLPGASFPTTRLGFGCAYIVGGWQTRASLRQLDAAFDAGYRHFDVAPPYGLGTAEAILGKALVGRRDKVTVATKIGIVRPQHSNALLLARSLARPVRKFLPSVSKSMGVAMYSAATQRRQFAPAVIAKSLDESRRALNTERIDLLLLHEVMLADLTDDLLTYLSREKSLGSIGSIGTATSVAETSLIRQVYGRIFDVWQHSWDLSLDSEEYDHFTITHRVLSGSHVYLKKNPSVLAILSDECGMDLADPLLLNRLLIGVALAANPNGVVLASSRNPSHILANASTLHDEYLAEVCKKFLRHVRLARSSDQSVDKGDSLSS
ncbi:aldo/keto reductase [Bradyrhizobium ottawaense]|uniref:aldo/keto reductase n=1 Tax=Bradyrhizobium ottawaense TaxID=931866 RepID=UPI001BA4B8E1|nr:aldo/keto reductase [Bradyrhizobium ottawaense]MBR1329072.1 aldo/keto reductase [Bradyrhizobium ottawaense]